MYVVVVALAVAMPTKPPWWCVVGVGVRRSASSSFHDGDSSGLSPLRRDLGDYRTMIFLK
jgi:hypothetical protein